MNIFVVSVSLFLVQEAKMERSFGGKEIHCEVW